EWDLNPRSVSRTRIRVKLTLTWRHNQLGHLAI
ncbi:unnamed protein product, partial [Tuber aestivum]